MSESDKAVEEICSMLGNAFDKLVVEKCYFGNNCDKDRTVDFLLNLTDYEVAELKRSINDRKAKASSNKFGMLDDDDDSESISEIMPPRPPMETRPQVYENILSTFGQELPEAELRRIYLKITEGAEDLDTITDDELLDIAVDQILQHIEVRNSGATDSEGVPVVSESKDFESFCRMFDGVIKDKKLKKIWREVEKTFQSSSSSPVSEEDLSDLAIMHALEFLDEQDERDRAAAEKLDAEIAASLASEEDYVVVDNKAEYDGYEVLSAEELTFDFVQRQLPATVEADEIRAALVHFNQDPMDAIVYLSLKAAGEIEERDFIPVQPSSSSAATKTDTASVSESTTSTASSRVEKRQKILKAGANSKALKDPRYRSVLDPRNPRNTAFGAHFVDLLTRTNPGIVVKVNDTTKLIEFKGFDREKMVDTRRNNKNYDKFQASNVAVDLHGLHVPYAIQTVHSVLDYYIHTCKTAEEKVAACDRNVDTNGTHMYIKFIVGKGLHSKGGIAKIRPEVERYLANERENEVDFVWLEGVILVSIKK